MKITIDLKSIAIGIAITIGVIALTSWKTQKQEEEDFEIVPSVNASLTVYNKKEKLLYQYFIAGGARIKSKPNYVYKIVPDGSELIEVKQ